MQRRWVGLAGLALATAGAPAWADVTGRYENTEEDPFIDMEMTIETDDHGNVRMQSAGQPNYYLLKDGVVYAVSRGSTGPSVVRVADLLTVQAETLTRMGVSDRFTDRVGDAPRMEFVAIGPATVGGWTGTAYGFKSRSSDSTTRPTLVLSHDPRIAPLGRAMVAMQANMAAGMGRLSPIFTQLGRDYEALMANGTPVRMMEIELTDVSFEAVDPERFALPTLPMSIDELRAQSSPFPAPPTLPPRD
jgi:hypothetical protein